MKQGKKTMMKIKDILKRGLEEMQKNNIHVIGYGAR